MTEAKEDIWASDTLGRKADAEFLIDFLLGRIEPRGRQGLPRSYVLNVDAGWGGGKTFFMSRLAKELRQRGFGVAEIDAWQDDHAEDPLLSLMSGIETTINPLVKGHKALQSTYKTVRKAGLNIAAAGIKGALKHAGRKVMGDAMDEIAEQIGALKDDIAKKGQEDLAKTIDKAIDKSTEKLLEGFEEGKKSIGEFKTQLGKLIGQIRKDKPEWTLFVLVDELDRCRPPYAIALLERVKHLYNVDHVVFVIATDTAQLSHSICAVYGAGFDGKKYLTRFFDRTYQLPETSIDLFVTKSLEEFKFEQDKISLPPGISLHQLIVGSLNAFSSTLRETKRSIEIIFDVTSAWRQKVNIEGIILIPLVVGYRSGKINLLDRGSLSSCAQAMSTYGALTVDFSRKYSGNQNQMIVNAGQVMATLSEQMQDLHSAVQRDTHSPEARWCHQRFFEELQAIHNSVISSGKPPKSIMASYPQLIATAGRLQSTL